MRAWVQSWSTFLDPLYVSVVGTDGRPGHSQEICYLPSWPFPIIGGDPYDMTPRCVSLNDTAD